MPWYNYDRDDDRKPRPEWPREPDWFCIYCKTMVAVGKTHHCQKGPAT